MEINTATCINNYNYEDNLTEGNTYQIIACSHGMIDIRDDTGETSWYDESLFKLRMINEL
jgi:hypothetical protein